MAVVVGPVTAQGQRGQPTPTPATGTAFLAGQVVESPSGRAVPQSIVSLFPVAGQGRAGLGGRQLSNPVVTDAQGRFFFADLPAGRWAIQATKAGYSNSTPILTRAIDVADGERL